MKTSFFSAKLSQQNFHVGDSEDKVTVITFYIMVPKLLPY